jgi:hypothetical protein
MANRGYDFVVDVDAEVFLNTMTHNANSQLTLPKGDLGHTDLQEDLEFHNSSTLTSHCGCIFALN